MKKNSIKERAKKVPAEIKSMIARSMGTAKAINRILEKQGKTQRDLAKMLNKKEAEISKWMRGTHNFTFLTICKIEEVLGERLILLPEEAIQKIYIVQPVKANSEQAICFKSSKEYGYTSISKDVSFFSKQNVPTYNKVGSPFTYADCLN
ncbi:MAG: helix-turn-helix transcriptional regulator [Bacteroidetes bacterium]|nr:helix-turn-helix transcriptional regulator [Bacteroidota bacterium]